MSVLIKGMEMPKNCGECIWIQRGYPDWCDLPMGKDLYNDKKRPDWCPLVEVPTPHGRLIDGEKAKEELRRAEALTRAFGYHYVIETISEVPTIIEAEEGEA